MATGDRPGENREREEPVPWPQVIFDDVYLLLAAGLVIPTLFYIVWGLWELANVGAFPF